MGEALERCHPIRGHHVGRYGSSGLAGARPEELNKLVLGHLEVEG